MCVCLHRIACHTAISIIWHTKKFNFVKLGVELKMNWSIPISADFQFQFNSNSKSFNSIPIQFMLNWIESIINSNSIHELIRALISTHYQNFWGHLLLSWCFFLIGNNPCWYHVTVFVFACFAFQLYKIFRHLPPESVSLNGPGVPKCDLCLVLSHVRDTHFNSLSVLFNTKA